MATVRSTIIKAAGAAIVLGAIATGAQAKDRVFWSVGIDAAPGVTLGVGNVRPVQYGPPVYVQPAPVYAYPQPVYGAPVYSQPVPVYTQPRVYYPPQPVYVQPAPVYYDRPGWRHGHGRGHWRDRDGDGYPDRHPRPYYRY